MNRIIYGDNLKILSTLPSKTYSLIYIDPPFNTGRDQIRGSTSYQDSFADYETWLMARIQQALHCLTHNGSIMVHLDHHEVHYIKVALDKMFGRDHFMNEIIWAYDYGGRSKNRWSCKHDTILWYVVNPKGYIFNYDEIDRIPYLAPSLVGADKAARGKTPTDVHWHTIVPTMGREKTGWPTQKPLGLLNRFIKVHSNPNDMVLDFFAGSGTTGEAAAMNGRGFTLIDNSPEAISVMKHRLSRFNLDINLTATTIGLSL